MQPAVRFVLASQVCFYAGLLLCIILKPHGLTANEGISYYGVYRETILPYIFSLLGAAYFTIKTAEQLTGPGQAIVRYTLTVIGLLTIGVMVTPDTLSQFVDLLHRTCGILLFVLQLLLSFWFAARLWLNLSVILLVAVELAGGIAAFIWLAPPQGLLLESQVVFQLGFGGALMYALVHWEKLRVVPLEDK